MEKQNAFMETWREDGDHSTVISENVRWEAMKELDSFYVKVDIMEIRSDVPIENTTL